MQTALFSCAVLQHVGAGYSVHAVCTFLCSSAVSGAGNSSSQARSANLHLHGGRADISVSLSLQMTTNHGAVLSLLAGVQESTELWVLPSGWRYCLFNRILQDGCAVVPVH